MMSSLPSPLKSPTRMSTQVTVVGQGVPQGEEVKAVLPLESATHHRPVCSTRPVMSALPWPSKSPTLTSTQVTVVGQAPHTVLLKELPSEAATHHLPVGCTRPAMSSFLSPVKSPTRMSTQLTAVLHWPHRLRAKAD